MTSPPKTACIVSACKGLVIAEVMPAAIAIVRNALLIPFLLGKPKLTDGSNEIKAERIVYNIETRSMKAEGRVRGIFIPSGGAKMGAPEAK